MVVVDLVIRLFFLFPQSPIRLEINPKLGRRRKKKKEPKTNEANKKQNKKKFTLVKHS